MKELCACSGCIYRDEYGGKCRCGENCNCRCKLSSEVKGCFHRASLERVLGHELSSDAPHAEYIGRLRAEIAKSRDKVWVVKNTNFDGVVIAVCSTEEKARQRVIDEPDHNDEPDFEGRIDEFEIDAGDKNG